MKILRLMMVIIGSIVSGVIGLGFMIIKEHESLVVQKGPVGLMLVLFCCVFMTEVYQQIKSLDKTSEKG